MFVAKESHRANPCADVVALNANRNVWFCPQFTGAFKDCCVHASLAFSMALAMVYAVRSAYVGHPPAGVGPLAMINACIALAAK